MVDVPGRMAIAAPVVSRAVAPLVIAEMVAPAVMNTLDPPDSAVVPPVLGGSWRARGAKSDQSEHGAGNELSRAHSIGLGVVSRM